MRVIDPGRKRTKVCQFWTHATDDRPWQGPVPPAVAYVFAEGRGEKEIAERLKTMDDGNRLVAHTLDARSRPSKEKHG